MFESLGWIPYFTPALGALFLGTSQAQARFWHWSLQAAVLIWTIAACYAINNAMAAAAFGLMFVGSLGMGSVALIIRKFI